MDQVREQVSSAMHNVELDEQAQHQEAPQDYKESLLFRVKCGVTNVKSNAARVFRSVFCTIGVSLSLLPLPLSLSLFLLVSLSLSL